MSPEDPVFASLEQAIRSYERLIASTERLSRLITATRIGSLIAAAGIAVLAAMRTSWTLVGALAVVILLLEAIRGFLGSVARLDWYRWTYQALVQERQWYLAAIGPYSPGERGREFLAERLYFLVSAHAGSVSQELEGLPGDESEPAR